LKTADLAAKASMWGVFIGEDSLCMRKRGAETWSARMKRMFGLLGSGISPELTEVAGVLSSCRGGVGAENMVPDIRIMQTLVCSGE